MTIHIGRNALLVIGAVLVVALGAVWAGLIPLYLVLWLGVVLICPLMMFFMMRGMHGGYHDHVHPPVHPLPPTAGRHQPRG